MIGIVLSEQFDIYFPIMIVLKKLFRFYIQSSMHVAFAVASLTMVTWMHFNLEVDYHLLGFNFLGTIVGYNFVKYAGVANLHHLRLTKHLAAIRLFTIICLTALVYTAFHISLQTIFVGGFFGSLTVLYALPLFKKTNLRSLKGVKIFIIGLVWAGTTVIVPLIEYQHLILPEFFIEFSQRFLFVVALMIPFEIRDLKYDTAGIGTIPQIFGIQQARRIGLGLLFFMLLLEMLKTEVDVAVISITALIAILTAVFIYKSKIEQPPYYASFWVEGIPILWWVILWTSGMV